MTQTSTAPADQPGEIYPEVGQIYAKPVLPKLSAVIREDAWRRFCSTHGYTSDVALGREMGVSPTTIWRIRTRQARPGIGFVLQAMRTFGATFEELFETVVEADASELDSVEQAA